jgi:hypothetical protein
VALPNETDEEARAKLLGLFYHSEGVFDEKAAKAAAQ